MSRQTSFNLTSPSTLEVFPHSDLPLAVKYVGAIWTTPCKQYSALEGRAKGKRNIWHSVVMRLYFDPLHLQLFAPQHPYSKQGDGVA